VEANFVLQAPDNAAQAEGRKARTVPKGLSLEICQFGPFQKMNQISIQIIMLQITNSNYQS